MCFVALQFVVRMLNYNASVFVLKYLDIHQVQLKIIMRACYLIFWFVYRVSF